MCAFACTFVYGYVEWSKVKWSGGVFAFTVPCRCLSLISDQNRNLWLAAFKVFGLDIVHSRMEYDYCTRIVLMLLVFGWKLFAPSNHSLTLIAVDSNYNCTNMHAHKCPSQKYSLQIHKTSATNIVFARVFDVRGVVAPHLQSHLMFTWEWCWYFGLQTIDTTQKKKQIQTISATFRLLRLHFKSVLIFWTAMCIWSIHAMAFVYKHSNVGISCEMKCYQNIERWSECECLYR